MNQRINPLTGLQCGPLRHVLQTQLIERSVLRQRCSLQIQQVIDIQRHVGHHVAGLHESAPIDERGGRELTELCRSGQCPGLHEVARLHRPLDAVFREVNDAVAVLQRSERGEI